MNEVTLQVDTFEAFADRALAMARALDRGERTPQRAVRSFESMAGLLKLLTANRWALMAMSRKLGASSVRALAKALGRDYRGVHADVALLVDAGLISRGEGGEISVPWTRITAEMDLGAAA